MKFSNTIESPNKLYLNLSCQWGTKHELWQSVKLIEDISKAKTIYIAVLNLIGIQMPLLLFVNICSLGNDYISKHYDFLDMNLNFKNIPQVILIYSDNNSYIF